MQEKILLCDFLQERLKLQGLSATELAKRIARNGGTIRAIVSGTRVPKLRSDIMIEIANELNIEVEAMDSYHLASIKDKKLKSSPKKPGRPSRQISQLAEPLTDIGELKTTEDTQDYRPKTGKIKSIPNIVELLNIKIRILNDLLSEPVPENNHIFITFQGKKSIFEGHEDFGRKYQKSLEKVIAHGWNVIHLIRLDPLYRERTYEVVSNSFRFFGGKGDYSPRYFSSRSVLKAPYGLFLVSNREAILSVSTEDYEAADSGIYIREKESINTLELHFKQLIKQTKPVFKVYQSYEQPEFVERLRIADREPGDHIVIARRLSEITRPLGWYDENHPWAKRLLEHLASTTLGAPPDLSRHIENRRRRAMQLRDCLDADRNQMYRYIYPRFILERFVEDGAPIPYFFKASKEYRRQQIKEMLKLLEKTNYEMALVEDDEEDVFHKIKPSFCEVQGSHFVMMESCKKNPDGKSLSTWYVSEEPVVVRAFQEALSQMWAKIDPDYKDKFLVSTWLRRKLEQIKTMIDS